MKKEEEAKMLYINCPLCDKDQPQLLFMRKGYAIQHCTNCGLRYVNPIPSKDELRSLYNADEDLFFQLDEKYVAADLKKNYIRKLDLIEKYTKRGKILEVGCGSGFFLEAAKKRGWDVYGIEPNEKTAKYGIEKKGLTNVVTTTFEDAEFPNNYFDVVCLFHVLEHTSDPLLFLNKAKSIIKRDGLVYVAVPNLDDRVYDFVNATLPGYIKKELISALGSICPPEHLIIFSTKTLNMLIKKVGFKSLEIILLRNVYTFSMNKKLWTFEKIIYPLLALLKSGRQVEIIAKKE